MFLSNDHWYNAYIATTIVSILPNVLLVLIPIKLLKEKTFRGVNVRHILLCFAAAGLLGDVFIHTIPHLLGAHDHDHGSHGEVSDSVHQHHVELHPVNLADGHHAPVHHHNHDHDDHGHHDHHHKHHHEHRVLHEEHKPSVNLFTQLTVFGLEKNLVIQLLVVWGFLLFFMAEKIAKQYCVGHSHDHSHEHKDHDTKKNFANSTKSESHGSIFHAMYYKLQSSGWLNLFADSMHNFTDGIAIGASFASAGHGLGFATFVSVICHEIPHEIGDFTILVNNGLSKSEAIKAQFLTAIAALLGTAVGLLAQRNESMEQSMLAFSAGGFLYIATVNILPDIVNEKSGVLQIVLELTAFALGIVMMVLVAVFE